MPRSLLDEIESDVVSDKPLADVLRKCVVLGGRAGSVELREWATRELRGYETDDDAPSYRHVAAGIFADAVTGSAIVKGQRLGASGLPEWARDTIEEKVVVKQGVGEIEAWIKSAETASETSLCLSLPMSVEIGRVIDAQSGNPFQHITALYWKVPTASLGGVLDQVRTSLTELVAEIRAGSPAGTSDPGQAVTDQAVSIAIHGAKNRLTVTTAHTGAGTATATAPGPTEAGWWTIGRRIGAVVVGLATIAAAVFGYMAVR